MGELGDSLPTVTEIHDSRFEYGAAGLGGCICMQGTSSLLKIRHTAVQHCAAVTPSTGQGGTVGLYCSPRCSAHFEWIDRCEPGTFWGTRG